MCVSCWTFRTLGRFLKTDYVQNVSKSKKTGSAIRRIILKDIRTLKIFLPDLNKQEEFIEKSKIIGNIKKIQKESSKETYMLFDALLQKAFKGELVAS